MVINASEYFGQLKQKQHDEKYDEENGQGITPTEIGDDAADWGYEECYAYLG
ncbi:MAG: hypothetical protein AB1345_07115 [Chloroflexota bacterium]